ncbi:MAG: hypothetical protein ACLP9C_00710 [Acidimicrobiales bacterium]
MGAFNTFNEIVDDPDRSRFSKVVDAGLLTLSWTGALGCTVAAFLYWQLWPVAVLLWGLAITLSFSSWYGTPRRSARARRRLSLEERWREDELEEAASEDAEAKSRIEASIEAGDRAQGTVPPEEASTPTRRAVDPWGGDPAPH